MTSAPPPRSETTRPPARGRNLVVAYGALLAVGVALFTWIRVRGEALPHAPTPEGATGAKGGTHGFLLFHVLVGLAVVTLVARFVGGVFRRYLSQPPVMGEILAGILLGPSLLGWAWPEAQAALIPAEAAPYLGILAKIGVVLFMFLVGLELDPKLLRGNTMRMAWIAHASIVTPFVLGAALALVLYTSYAPPGVSFTVFALFLGVSLSVTAFPVLARILRDRGVANTKLGATAMACAALDDVTAWMILAVIASVASAESSGYQTPLHVLGYGLVMGFVVRPLLVRYVARVEATPGPLSHTTQAIVLTLLLASAAATEAIGIHALFGAFALGALIPHDGPLSHGLRERLTDVVVVLFLPLFFVYTGLRTHITLLADPTDWAVCAAIVAVATLGKFGGTYVAARFAGMAGRRSAALGILMNTRGLMELIVLNLGLDLGVLSPRLFAMLVVMALVTTFATTPILDRLLGPRGFEDDATA